MGRKQFDEYRFSTARSVKRIEPYDLGSGLERFLNFLTDRIALRVAELVAEWLGTSKQNHSSEGARLVDVTGASAYLGTSTSAAYKLSSAGKLSSVKVGGQAR